MGYLHRKRSGLVCGLIALPDPLVLQQESTVVIPAECGAVESTLTTRKSVGIHSMKCYTEPHTVLCEIHVKAQERASGTDMALLCHDDPYMQWGCYSWKSQLTHKKVNIHQLIIHILYVGYNITESKYTDDLGNTCTHISRLSGCECTICHHEPSRARAKGACAHLLA